MIGLPALALVVLLCTVILGAYTVALCRAAARFGGYWGDEW